MVENGCPEEFRPTWCEQCQSEAKFHKHGNFTRSVLTAEEQLEIKIFRFKCTSCSSTCSVLPPFLRRNHTASLDAQEHVVQSNSEGVALRAISGQLDFSEKTLWRWKNYWQKLLDKLNPSFWPTVLARFPHLILPRGGSTPRSQWEWVFWVWGQTRQHLTDKPTGCLQWLNFLSQPLAVAAGA